MQSRPIIIGNNTLLLTEEDFLNGYQAGHLAYMAEGRGVRWSDTSLRTLHMTMLESMDHSEAFCFGYVVGWLVTFTSKGPLLPESTPA